MQRVESSDLVKVTYYISREIARYIKQRSFDLDITQSKYIEDLVRGKKVGD